MENEIKEEKQKNSKLLIVVLVVIIILLVAALCYFVFIKKDNTDTKEEEKKEEVITEEVKHVVLTSENQVVVINNKKLNLKVVDSSLYIDDAAHDYIIASDGVYVTAKYALIAEKAMNGVNIDYAITEDGKVINVYKSIIDDSSYSAFEFKNIKNDNGKVVADYLHESCVEESNNCDRKVEFDYNGNYIVIREMNLENGVKPLTRYFLTESNLSVEFNGNTVKLKEVDGTIYYNDKVVKEFEDYGSFDVFVSEKLIFISMPGAQCETVFVGAINENGEFVEIDTENHFPVYGLYSKDGVVMGTGYECIMTEEDTDFDAKFVYDGNKIKFIKIS